MGKGSDKVRKDSGRFRCFEGGPFSFGAKLAMGMGACEPGSTFLLVVGVLSDICMFPGGVFSVVDICCDFGNCSSIVLSASTQFGRRHMYTTCSSSSLGALLSRPRRLSRVFECAGVVSYVRRVSDEYSTSILLLSFFPTAPYRAPRIDPGGNTCRHWENLSRCPTSALWTGVARRRRRLGQRLPEGPKSATFWFCVARWMMKLSHKLQSHQQGWRKKVDRGERRGELVGQIEEGGRGRRGSWALWHVTGR